MNAVIRGSLILIAITMLLTQQFTRPLVLDIYTSSPSFGGYNRVIDQPFDPALTTTLYQHSGVSSQ